jgi:hypothetical protein
MLLGEEVRSEDDAMVGNINEVCASGGISLDGQARIFDAQQTRRPGNHTLNWVRHSFPLS